MIKEFSMIHAKREMFETRLIIVMLAIIFWAGAAIAQEQEEENAGKAVAMEKMVVWGTEVESSSLTLGDDQISIKQADHLSDLLRDIPGVDVGGTHSINNRINIRGFQDEDVEMTLDGAKIQNANMFHHIGNLLINPDILKRAELQVGTNSVVNGSLGGAVSFETKDGQDLLRYGKSYGARVSANYNANDDYGGSFAGYGKITESFDFLVYYRHVEKRNWTDGNDVKTFGVEGAIYNAVFKVAADLGENQRISLSYDTLHDEGDYSPRPDFGRDYNEARTGLYTYPTEYDRQTITLKHKLDLGDAIYMTTSIYSNENVLERFEYLDGETAVRPGYTEGLLIGEVKTQGVNLKARSVIDAASTVNTLTYGATYDKQTSEVTFGGEKYGEDEEAISVALFLEDEIHFDFGLTLTPGIRYNYYDFDGAYGEIDDSEITYGLAGEYEITEGFSLLASTTTLYKGVEMVDVLASNRTLAADNEDLKSETGVNNQVGIKYDGRNVLGADSFSFMFTYFQTEIDDYITSEWNYDNYPVYWVDMVNGGTLDISGFEASLMYEIGDLSTILTYSHSDSEFEETKDPVVKEPGDMFTLGLTYYLLPQMRVQWDSVFVAEEDDRPADISSTNTYAVKEAYNVHDIALKWKPRSVPGLSIIAGIDNVFDEAYVSHISENRLIAAAKGGELKSTADEEPGRSFKVTLAYRF